MRNGNSLTERLDALSINWTIGKNKPAARATVTFTQNDKYVGCVTGLGNARRVGELVCDDKKDLLEAIFECGGWVGFED